jgi:hypothetical protein
MGFGGSSDAMVEAAGVAGDGALLVTGCAAPTPGAQRCKWKLQAKAGWEDRDLQTGGRVKLIRFGMLGQ